MASSTLTIPPNEDRGPQLLAIYWTGCTVATIIVALRVYSRIKIKGLGLDDWTILFTMVREHIFLSTSRQHTKNKCVGSCLRPRWASHLGGYTWRLPTSLLPTRLGHLVRSQAELDDPTNWHHGPRNFEDIRCIHYAENHQLRQRMAQAFFVFLHWFYLFDLCYCRHFDFCTMQSSESIVDFCAWRYMLGSQSAIELRNFYFEYGPIFVFDKIKERSILTTSNRL